MGNPSHQRPITVVSAPAECRLTVGPRTICRGLCSRPAWSLDGRFVVYSGPDIGTTFSVKAINVDGAAHPLPALTLTRGTRHLAFLDGGRALVFLRGEIRHEKYLGSSTWKRELRGS